RAARFRLATRPGRGPRGTSSGGSGHEGRCGMVTVTVYSTGESCVRCRLTLRKLDDTGIAHTVIDLTDPAAEVAREYLTGDLGYSEAPVVIVDDQPEHHWAGFRPDLIDRLAAPDSDSQVHP